LVELQSTIINVNAMNIFFMVILGGYYRIINADLFSNGTSSIDAQTRPMFN